MYTGLLLVHSWLRWLVIIFGLLTVFTALGKGRRDGARSSAERFGLFFMISLDTEVLIGLVLYFFSTPWLSMLMTDAGATMGNRLARFWAVEHIFGMVVAVVLAHVGRVSMKRETTSDMRARKLAIWTAIAMIFTLCTIPWPFMPYARPWFRM